MDEKLIIRQATKEDLFKITEITHNSFPWFLRCFAIHSLLSNKGSVIVGKKKKSIVGYAKLIVFQIKGNKYGCILWLAVDPSFQRRGFASQLVEAGTNILQESGVKSVFACIQRRNKASLSTFIKKGYVPLNFNSILFMFGSCIIIFYNAIWFAPGEIVMIQS